MTRGIPDVLKTQVLARDGYTDDAGWHRMKCHYCGRVGADPIEYDHITPRHQGGTDTIDNIVIACRPCNRSKGTKTVAEWVQTLAKARYTSLNRDQISAVVQRFGHRGES